MAERVARDSATHDLDYVGLTEQILIRLYAEVTRIG